MNFQPLTDLEWEKIQHLFPNPIKRSRGKPHAPWRSVVNSILMVLCTKTKWSQIPQDPNFATKSVAHRWFALWDKSGILQETLSLLSNERSCFKETSTPPRRNRLPKPTTETFSPAATHCSLVAAKPLTLAY